MKKFINISIIVAALAAVFFESVIIKKAISANSNSTQ
jgi:hypothetical protein